MNACGLLVMNLTQVVQRNWWVKLFVKMTVICNMVVDEGDTKGLGSEYLFTHLHG